MMEKLSTILAILLLATARLVPAAESPEAPRPDPEKIRAALERLRTAPAEERVRARKALVALGPSALEETRKARDAAADPEVRSALDRAALELLTEKLQPILEERQATNLTFDGQYDDLKGEGPEAAKALLFLFNDDEALPSIRIAAARALADLRDASILPALRRMAEDPLFAYRLREEAGTLLAILGDTSHLDRKIQTLARKVESRRMDRLKDRSELELLQIYEENADLSNFYYRIRQYRKAVECYDRAIKALEEFKGRRRGLIPQIEQWLSLSYYNAACSLSLDGEVERARDMLRKAIAIDPTHLKNIDKDGDFRKLREAPGHDEFKRSLEKPLEKKSI